MHNGAAEVQRSATNIRVSCSLLRRDGAAYEAANLQFWLLTYSYRCASRPTQQERIINIIGTKRPRWWAVEHQNMAVGLHLQRQPLHVGLLCRFPLRNGVVVRAPPPQHLMIAAPQPDYVVRAEAPVL